MKKNITAFFLLAIILCSSIFQVSATEGTTSSNVPEINAKAALLIELNTGSVIYEKSADDKVYPASLTKIMTCLLTLENGTLTDTVTVSNSAITNLDAAGSTIGLMEGEELSVGNLLYAMMLSSANESCNVAAEYVSGNITSFVDQMNQRAAELGCTGTHFVNPHGLHDDNHYTTARDLSIIVQEALKYNTFRTIVATPEFLLPATNLSEARKLTTTNQLIIPSQSNKYYDSRVTGVKTGFTTPAGRCLIATADDGPISLLSIVCGCETIILDTGDLLFASFPETAKLLEYGFESFVYIPVLPTLYPIAEIQVAQSASSDTVSLAPQEEISALLPCDYDPALITQNITTSDSATAPISAGEKFGSVTVSYDGRVLGTTSLIAITSVEKANFLTPAHVAATPAKTWLRIILLSIIVLCLLFAAALFLRYEILKRRRMKERREKMHYKRTTDTFGSSDWFERE